MKELRDQHNKLKDPLEKSLTICKDLIKIAVKVDMEIRGLNKGVNTSVYNYLLTTTTTTTTTAISSNNNNNDDDDDDVIVYS